MNINSKSNEDLSSSTNSNNTSSDIVAPSYSLMLFNNI